MVAEACAWLGLGGNGLQGTSALKRPAWDESELHAAAVKDFEAIDGTQEIGGEGGNRSTCKRINEQFVNQKVSAGCDLTATLQSVGNLRHRFKAPAITGQGRSLGREIKGHRLQAALKHEGSRHAGIVFKMAIEELFVCLKTFVGS